MLLLALAFVGVHPRLARAGSDAGETYQFALWLQARQEYYRAITEFKRTIFLAGEQNPTLRQLSEFHIGRSYFLGGEWDRAVHELEAYGLSHPEGALYFRSRLLLGRAHLEAGRFEEAHAVFRVDEALLKDDPERPGREFQNRFIEEDGWASLYAWKLPDAMGAFGQLAEASPDDSRVAGLTARVQEGLRVRRRSPAAAGVLSAILPGAGQWYSGRVADGFVSLLVNALFIWGGVAAYEKDMDEVAAVLGFIELGWYSGNIYGAVDAAHRFNRNERSHFIQDLELDFRLPAEDL